MRLQKIEIENFGIYKDLCIFNFPYNEQKRVSLLIGKNGSGKTTFLNAIKVGLYGTMLFGTKNTNTKYENYINNVLNHDAKENKESRYVINITFLSNFHKYDGVFSICRSWDLSSSHLTEKVTLYKQDKRVTDEESEEFFNAFYRFYPLEFFDMFYLDGEKIDHLGVLHSNIYSLVETSMNIDLFKHLKNDLETYAIKKLNTSHLNELESEKYSIETDLEKSVRQKETHNQEVHSLMVEKDSLNDQLRNLVERISEAKLSLPETIKSVNSKLNLKKKDLASYLNDSVPFLFLNKEINSLILTLQSEHQADLNRIVRESMNDDLITYLSNLKLDKISQNDIQKIVGAIQNKFSVETFQLHRINSDDQQNIENIIQKIKHTNINNIKVLVEDYQRDQETLKLLNEQSKKNSVNELEIEAMINQMLSYQKDLTLISNRITTLEEELLNIDKEEPMLKMRLQSIESDIWKALKSSNINSIIGDISAVLEEYMDTVKNSKIEKIQDSTLYMFNLLIRKENFIKKIVLDASCIVLHDHSGHILTVDKLSSGERQLLILSIIYAILCVSERSIPLIFDTLLGRLDKNHQQQVYECFIARCPDQIIVLATDSEMENIHPATIELHTNTLYKIDFSQIQNKIIELR